MLHGDRIGNARRTALGFALIVTLVFVFSGIATATSSLGAVPTSHPALPVASVTSSRPLSAATGPWTSVSPASPAIQPGFASQNGGGFEVVPSSAPLPAAMNVMVSLTAPSSLSAYASAIQQPGGPVFDNFLSNAQIGQYFGASPATLSGLTSYFEAYGLSAQASTDGLSVEVSGSTQALASAFHTRLAMYQELPPNTLPGALPSTPSTVIDTPFVANLEPASLPESLATFVNGVVGFDGLRASPTLATPVSSFHGTPASPSTPQASNCELQVVTDVCLDTQQAFNDTYGNYTWGGTNDTDQICVDTDDELCDLGDYQLLVPGSIPAAAGAYNLWDGASTLNKLPDEGQGITLAVVEVGCIQPTTIGNFSQDLWGNPNQLLDRFTEIALPYYGASQGNLGYCDYVGEESGWNGETALDIEYASAMAPKAHIDLVGIGDPDAEFSSFDSAYAFIAQYMDTGATCNFPAATEALIVYGSGSNGACTVTIDSNSYGGPELADGFLYGSPLYLTVENDLLTVLAVEGISNFFASADYGSFAAYDVPPESSMPAISAGAISVGGGQLSLNGPDGVAFPSLVAGSSGVDVAECTDQPATGACTTYMTLNVTQTESIRSFTYWSYGLYLYGYGGTYYGYEGGGHGVDFSLSTPWWQVANDSFTSGARIDPVVSGAAAFNMTLLAPSNQLEGSDEGWEPFYGGTSFATPITAAEWALVEEQAQLVTHSTGGLGDASSLLYWMHDANQAGVSSVSTDPYVPFQYAQPAFDTANWDSFGWYFANLSETFPSEPNLPSWAYSIANPAGLGWEFLGGLGMLLPTPAVAALAGTDGGAVGGLASGLAVEEVSGTSTSAVTWLAAGAPLTFEVISTSTGTPVAGVDIWAYSGAMDQGSYGGGTMEFVSSATGTFTWTPTYASGGPVGNYSQYGYFLIAKDGAGADSPWLFNAFSVGPALPSSTANLELSLDTPYGPVSSGDAQTTTFFTYDSFSDYNWATEARVTLNGVAVGGAVVYETSESWNFSTTIQPGVPWPSSLWGPGAPLLTVYTDTSGSTYVWNDANSVTAESDAVLPTLVFNVQASYEGVWTQNITLWVEPQTGYYLPGGLAVTYVGSTAYVTGDVSFVGMKYLDSLNVSLVGLPGDYEQLDCGNWAAFCPVSYGYGYGYSSTFSGSVPINFTVPDVSPDQALWVDVSADGNNSLSIISGVGNYLAFTQPNWNFSWQLPNTGPAPHALLTSTPTGPTVSGTVTLSYSGVWASGANVFEGAVGTVSLTSSSGTTVLATGTNLVNNGTLTYAWDTAGLWTGNYTVTMSVTTPTGLTATSSDILYVVPALSVPAIVATPAAVDLGQTVEFSAPASGGVAPYTYSWDFGDGSWSQATTPTHRYAATGTYTVTVWVNDSFGQSETLHTTEAVNPALSAVLTTPTQLVDFASSTVTEFETKVTGGSAPFTYGYAGLPTTGCTGTTTAWVNCTGMVADAYAVTVTVVDASGASVTSSVAVTVNAPLAGTLSAPSSVQAGTLLVVAAAITGGSPAYTYTWTGLPGGCTSSDSAVISCTPSSTGTFTVGLTVTDAAGGTATSMVTITVTSGAGLLGTSGSTAWLAYALLALIVVAALLGVLYLRERGKRNKSAPLAAGGAAAAGGAMAGSADAVSPPPPAGPTDAAEPPASTGYPAPPPPPPPPPA